MGYPQTAVSLPTDDPGVVDAVASVLADPTGVLSEFRRSLATPAADRPEQICGTAWVFDPAGEQLLLVLHRRLGWSSPGGHVDHGETPLAATVRELYEETGLAVRPVHAEALFVHLGIVPEAAAGPEHLHWSFAYGFVTTPDPVALLPEEGMPVGWFPLAALPDPRPADIAPLSAAARAVLFGAT